MRNKRQRKKELEEVWNPHIRTLDEALAFAAEYVGADESRRRKADQKAIAAVRERICTRFTGPKNFGQLHYGERLVFDVTTMEGEVLNGGFHQYLTNSSGDTAEEIKRYLKDIQAVGTLSLIERASDLFPNRIIPRRREQRCAIISEWEDKESGNDLFDELDRVFYREGENLNGLMLSYIRKHRSEFEEPSEEIVKTLKRHDRITEYFCGSAESEWVEQAEEALAQLTSFAESMVAERRAETAERISAIAKAGRRSEAIRAYREAFNCTLAQAKATVDRMICNK